MSLHFLFCGVGKCGRLKNNSINSRTKAFSYLTVLKEQVLLNETKLRGLNRMCLQPTSLLSLQKVVVIEVTGVDFLA